MLFSLQTSVLDRVGPTSSLSLVVCMALLSCWSMGMVTTILGRVYARKLGDYAQTSYDATWGNGCLQHSDAGSMDGLSASSHKHILRILIVYRLDEAGHHAKLGFVELWNYIACYLYIIACVLDGCLSNFSINCIAALIPQARDPAFAESIPYSVISLSSVPSPFVVHISFIHACILPCFLPILLAFANPTHDIERGLEHTKKVSLPFHGFKKIVRNKV